MFFKSLSLVPALLTATTLFTASVLALPGKNGLTKRAYDATACNNHPTLCNKKYSEIYHLGAHDSPFIRHPDNGYSVAGNQYFNVRAQLEGGVRLLQGQIHNEGGKPRLCHSECLMMDGGKLEDYLVIVKKWMDEHPSDVVTMLWVNADNMPVKDLEKYFVDTGIKDIAFVPSRPRLPPTEWPTLKQMIDKKQRLVLMLSSSTNETAIPWILDEFSYVFETPFENFDPAKFTCVADRPGGVKGPEKLKEAVASRIGFQNRFLYDKKLEEFGAQIYTPDPKLAPKINSGDKTVPGNLGDGIEKCKKEWGRTGGYVLVDFANEGNPIAVVDAANGFKDPRNRVNLPITFENQPKSLWEPTPSAGEMSLLFDKLQDGRDEVKENVVIPVKDKVVDPAKEKLKNELLDPLSEVFNPVITPILNPIKDKLGEAKPVKEVQENVKKVTEKLKNVWDDIFKARKA
ncbi:PLC-like phosphodiesterase [Peziza echinospora]|nr:PLC-like phosphodiesterase [Peziza echinospora]